ncbi:MAG: pentapeptide repeat-containing protein [Prochloraceae cyanobacterium]
MSEKSQANNQSKATLNTQSEEGWQELQNSFAQLEQLKDRDRQEYELHQAAQRHNLPVDIYRQLFSKYTKTQLIAQGREVFFLLRQSPQQSLKKAFNLLTRLGWLSLIGVAIALALQLAEIHQQQEYLSWAILSLNQGNKANGGRFLALETLMLFDSNLSGLNLENAILPGIELSGAELVRADFDRAILIEANLSNTILRNADFRKAHLQQANLSEADLELADLTGAILNQANLLGANFYRANLKGANLSGADLRESKNLEFARLYGAIYDVKTRFPENFNPANSGAVLIKPNANLAGINLRGAMLMKMDLRGVNLEGASLEEAVLYDANLTNANLKGASLKNALGLFPSQVKAASNWQQALYDEEFRQELGLPVSSSTPR